MSAASDELGARVRPLIGNAVPGIEEKRMFGGIGFMMAGNMAIGTTAQGALLVRIDPAKVEAALSRGAEVMYMGSRPMKGFVTVSPARLADDKSLRDWIAHALAYVKTLPPK